MLAERLVADRGFEVEVLTTCALDAITWRDELPEGTSVERGVTVRRIRSQAGRNEHFHPLWAQLMRGPGCRVGGGLRQVGGLAGSAGDRSRRGGGGERRRRGGVLPVPLLPDGVRAAVGAGAGGVASSCARGARAAPARLRRAVPHVSGVCVPQPERAGARQRSIRGGVDPAGASSGSAWKCPRSVRRRRRCGRRSGSGRATGPTWSASGGWTTRRGRACSGAGSAPTRSATRGR